jgi:hypothetical protein
MCRKRFELTRRAAIIALRWCVTPAPSALADDTPACVAPIFGFPEPGASDDEDWLLRLLAPSRGR